MGLEHGRHRKAISGPFGGVVGEKVWSIWGPMRIFRDHHANFRFRIDTPCRGPYVASSPKQQTASSVAGRNPERGSSKIQDRSGPLGDQTEGSAPKKVEPGFVPSGTETHRRPQGFRRDPGDRVERPLG